MQVQELLQQRKARGYEIASKGKITQDKGIWVVPSATNPRQSYKVQFTIYGAKCTCADFAERGIRCKHIFSVDYVIEKKLNKDGTTTTVITTKKMTYPQDWKNYTKAQCEEGTQFKVLLKDLVSNVPVKVRTGAGRPATPLNEALYCAIDKVYSMQSSRRAKSRYAEAVERQQITKAPNYNVINILLNDPELTPILRGLLHITESVQENSGGGNSIAPASVPPASEPDPRPAPPAARLAGRIGRRPSRVSCPRCLAISKRMIYSNLCIRPRNSDGTRIRSVPSPTFKPNPAQDPLFSVRGCHRPIRDGDDGRRSAGIAPQRRPQHRLVLDSAGGIDSLHKAFAAVPVRRLLPGDSIR